MASESAKQAATKVLEALGNGEKVVMGKILREVGYSDNTADSPREVTKSKSYQSTIAPFVEKLEKERDRILLEISVKDLDKEKHSDLVRSLDTITKNVQLLSGKETERTGVQINVVNYASGDTA